MPAAPTQAPAAAPATDPAARFWDRIAERYARRPVADEAAYREKLRITREHLGPGMTVLEFGCGTGTTAIAHAPHVRRIEAVDIAPRMIAIARGRAAEAGVENVAFRVAGLEQVRPPEGGYDAVMGHSVLHLLPDREAAIARVFGLLRPGGVFVSSTACIADMTPVLRPVLAVGRWLGLFPRVAVFGRETLMADLRRAGFEIAVEWQPKKGAAVFVVARRPS